jgi:phosphotransferase family enzyme
VTEGRDSRSTDPRPGTNLKGDAAGGAWTYLLDSLELDGVLCVGRPEPATLATLERIAATVTITDGHRLGALAGTFDLAFVPASGRKALTEPGAVGAVVRSLSRRGLLFVEGRGAGRLARGLAEAGLGRADTFWLTPAAGEVRSAVPLGDEPIRRYFAARSLTIPSLPRALRALERRFPIAASQHRVGLLTGHADTSRPDGPGVPAYIREMAAAAGVDLSGHRFGLSARGRYSSRKVILYVFAPGDERPELIVKATRDATHNARLVNEERALRRVAELGLIEPGTAPAVIFSGTHGGLSFVAESTLEGTMLSSTSDGEGPATAYEWLTGLSAKSARREATATAAIVSTVQDVQSTLGRVYSLDPLELDRLERATSTLIEHADRLPAVFMHGDAGAWNAMRLADGRVAFLDWEAAEFAGLPLWDLFYFARSHIVTMARLRGMARRPASLMPALQTDRELRAAVATYCRRLDIPFELVGPLFSLCWAHRALREVTRLEEGRLDEGHYLALLRMSLDPAMASSWDPQRRDVASAL